MNFLSKTRVGLDISDNSIEVVEISVSGGKKKISASNRIELTEGVVQGGRILNPELLEKALKKVFGLTKKDKIEPRNIIFGVPEPLVFNHLYSHLIISQESSIDEVIQKEARQSIPLTKGDLIFSYKNFEREQGEITGVIAAVSKKDLAEWQDFFRSIDFEVEVYEPKTNSLLRSIGQKDKKYPLCIVDIGSSATYISVFDRLGMIFNNSLKVGGEDIVSGIAQDLSIADMREVKNMAYGEGLSNPGSQLCNCIINVIDDIVREIKTSIEYIENKTGETVDTVLLSGGTALIPGIVDYFASNLNKEVKPAKLEVLGMRANEKKIMFLKAAGLALRSTDDSWKSDTYFEEKIPKKKPVKSVKITQKQILGETSVSPAYVPVQEKRTSNKILSHEKEILLVLLTIALIALLVFAFTGRSNESMREAYVPPEVQALLDNLPDVKESPPQIIEDEATTALEVTEEEEEKNELKILDTPTGWLNVRSGPGVENEIVGKVYPQEVYQFMDIENDWYIIRLSEKTDGWVVSNYVEEIPEGN